MAIKIRRGLEADRTSVIFEEGEVLYTTDTKSFFIGDGVTAGGNQIGGTTAASLLKTEVHNATGATLTAGQVVYLSGNTGNKPNAVLAKADSEATSSKTIGLIILDIANNANGDIATDGLLSDIDTSAFAPGDLLWLSDSVAGGVTTIVPDTPNHAVFIGYIVAAHPTQGKILIHIQNGYELNELHDVKITSVANGDGLIYDSALGYWKNSSEFTTQGNTFNAANKLVQLDASAKLPAVDGSQLTNLPTPSTPTLAQVTSAGNTTTNAISVGGLTVNLPTVSDTSYLKITSSTANTFNTYIGTTAVNQYAWFTNIRYNGTAFVRDNTTYTAWRMNQVVGNSATYDTFNLDHWSTTGVNSTLLTVFGWTGNVGINTTTDAGYKLDVNGTMRIKGTGTTSATSAFRVSNSSGNDLVRIDDSGRIITEYSIGFANSSRSISFSDLNNGLSYQGFGGHRFSAYNSSAYVNQLVITGNTLEPKIGIGLDVPLAKFHVSGTITAASAIARGSYFNNTLVAAANNDVLVGLDINPTFTNGAFTGVANYGVRIQSSTSLITNDINSVVRLQVSNISTGSQASAEFWLTSNGGTASWSKFSSNRTTYKIQKANDAGLYNGTAGDITFLNDVSTGKILFSAGGSATAQVTLFSNGNIGINTTTDSGYRLDVNGTVRVQLGLDLNNQAITNIGALSNSANLRLDANGTFGVIRLGSNQVGIGNNSTGDASALLTLTSTIRGFLPPRMTTTQKNAISTPAAGLVVYDTTLNKLCVYTTTWETVTSL